MTWSLLKIFALSLFWLGRSWLGCKGWQYLVICMSRNPCSQYICHHCQFVLACLIEMFGVWIESITAIAVVYDRVITITIMKWFTDIIVNINLSELFILFEMHKSTNMIPRLPLASIFLFGRSFTSHSVAHKMTRTIIEHMFFWNIWWFNCIEIDASAKMIEVWNFLFSFYINIVKFVSCWWWFQQGFRDKRRWIMWWQMTRDVRNDRLHSPHHYADAPFFFYLSHSHCSHNLQ